MWQPHSKAKAACVIPGFVIPTSDKLNDKHTQECVPAVQVLRALYFSLNYSPYLTLKLDFFIALLSFIFAIIEMP